MRDASLNKSECKRMNCMSLHQYFQNRSKSWLFLATLNQRTLFQSGQKQFIEQLQRHPTEYRTLTIFKLKCKNKETCFSPVRYLLWHHHPGPEPYNFPSKFSAWQKEREMSHKIWISTADARNLLQRFLSWASWEPRIHPPFCRQIPAEIPTMTLASPLLYSWALNILSF